MARSTGHRFFVACEEAGDKKRSPAPLQYREIWGGLCSATTLRAVMLPGGDRALLSHGKDGIHFQPSALASTKFSGVLREISVGKPLPASCQGSSRVVEQQKRHAGSTVFRRCTYTPLLRWLLRMHTNRLAQEKSPYLLQHAHNPVDWHAWGPEAFEKARAENKPIFLSIGYSTCHWCHVMERESFENERIAEDRKSTRL